MTTYRALAIRNCQLEEVQLEGRNSASDAINKIIGNYFTSAFRVDTEGKGDIMGFCDDEGLLTARQFEAVMGPMLRMDMQPIAGPLVIVGGDEEGETRSLTDAEIKNFALLDNEAVALSSLMQTGRVLPLLVYDPDLHKFDAAERTNRLAKIDRALPTIFMHVQREYMSVDELRGMIERA